jgi:hypothetical protein
MNERGVDMPTGVKANVDEDIAANLYAEGYSCRAISYQLHTSEERVAKVVKARFGDLRPRRYRKVMVLPRCKRCTILLSEAPCGDGELCGYCVKEIVAPGGGVPGATQQEQGETWRMMATTV